MINHQFVQRTFLTLAAICLIFQADLYLSPRLFAQGGAKPRAKAINKVDKNKKETAKVDEKGAAAEPAAKPAASGWTTEIAALGGVALPMGDAGTLLNMGFGGRADFTTHIPAFKFLKQGGFEIRPGFFAGALSASVKSSTKTGSFFTVPAVAYAEFDLTGLSKTMTPYFAIGGGASMSSATSTVTVAGATTAVGDKASVSSVDAALYAALGAKYYFGADKKIFVKAEAAFFMVFESVSGMFIQGNLGIGARL